MTPPFRPALLLTAMVATQPECGWSAVSQAGWITNVSPSSGQGSGQLAFQAAANPSTSTRTGEIVVNDGRVQIVQEGSPCVFAGGSPGSVLTLPLASCAPAPVPTGGGGGGNGKGKGKGKKK